jgi:2-oxoglutarate ferredoxin oxidoreductase subunit gamma
MQTEVVIAGFGGQGVLFAGQILAYAAMDAGKEVTWIPSYGPEMRGGTANCTVVIADEEIGSPLVRHPRGLIAMNLPSLDKYEHQIQPEGIIIINTSLVDRRLVRDDLKSVYLPANEIAESLGEKRLANIVLLGALITNLPVLDVSNIEQSIIDHLPEKHRDLLPSNLQALKLGAEFVSQEQTV